MKLSRHGCECGEDGDFFHYFRENLNDAKSIEVLKSHIITFIRNIWLASRADKLSPCVITAVRECIEVCKKTTLPVGPLNEFYNFLLEDKSLPVWIILHSYSDNPCSAKVAPRFTLLDLFLSEFVFTEGIRDELYLACATKCFNRFFSRIRQESLRQLQVREARAGGIEIGHGLVLPPLGLALAETLEVDYLVGGIRLKWSVPDLLQRLEPGRVMSTEFGARGQIWGIYIQPQCVRWTFVVCQIKPSPINLTGKDVYVSLKLARNGKIPFFESRSVKLATLWTQNMPTLDRFPVGGDMPNVPHFIIPILENSNSKGLVIFPPPC